MASSLVHMTATVVASHLSHSRMPTGGIKALIVEVYETLAELDAKTPEEAGNPERERAREAGRVRAAEAAASLQPPSDPTAPPCAGSDVVDPRWPGVHRDRIVCLEDQVPTVLLKGHLRRRHGMTPDQYRAKWNLPLDYPMAAPSYVERKREIAARDGLGTERRPGGRKIAKTVPAGRRSGTLGLRYGSAAAVG